MFVQYSECKLCKNNVKTGSVTAVILSGRITLIKRYITEDGQSSTVMKFVICDTKCCVIKYTEFKG